MQTGRSDLEKYSLSQETKRAMNTSIQKSRRKKIDDTEFQKVCENSENLRKTNCEKPSLDLSNIEKRSLDLFDTIFSEENKPSL